MAIRHVTRTPLAYMPTPEELAERERVMIDWDREAQLFEKRLALHALFDAASLEVDRQEIKDSTLG